MKPITEAVIKAGLLSPAMLAEMKRFSPTLDPEAEVAEPVSFELAATMMENAIQSEDQVITRETDLQSLDQYLATAKAGVLHVTSDNEHVDVDIQYGRTLLGEYMIAWRGESIRELLINGQTYLDENGVCVYFCDTRELYFGEQKAFMVCTPVVATETHGHRD